jgi:DAK2 domain fusion protein YloV
MIINAAAAIHNQKKELNDLNVFPVPDGDTGTNMNMTIAAAEKALLTMTPGTISHVADVSANAMLRGARGNSGVILSLLCRGFSRCLRDVDVADAVTIAQAMKAGVDSAYKAVMKPAEGTILTVSRLAADAAIATAEKETDIELVFEHSLAEAYLALAETVNQNPVLKKAGVVDSGAKGYIYMLEGMMLAIRGEFITKTASAETDDEGKTDFAQFSVEDIKFAYCTELMIERKSKGSTNPLRDFLGRRGDSVVVIDDEEIIKIHVHTNEPGAVITEALKYGSLATSKIENMHLQHSETLAQAGGGASAGATTDQQSQEPEEMKPFGIVAVCAGKGVEQLFLDLGVDRIITGGQTMNPSTADILEKINAAPSEVVFVLPNNKNIILAAEQCAPLTEKRVIVIPTKTIPQGVSAMIAADGCEDIDEIIEIMTDSAKSVRTSHITMAVRDSNYDGCGVKEGDYIALLDNSILSSGSNPAEVIDSVISEFKKNSPEFITIYSGEDITVSEAEELAEFIGTLLPDTEVTTVIGGQPVYHYIIAAE